MNAMQTKYLAAVMLCGSLLAVGCKNSTQTAAPAQSAATSPAAPAQPAAQGGVRNPDGSITNADGSVTYPPGSSAANQENAPNTPVAGPASATEPAPIVHRDVPAGTPIHVRTNGALSASRNEVGDRWTGTLEESVVSHGQTIFPRGTDVSGEVVAAKGKGRFKGAGDLAIELTNIGRARVHTSEYEQVGKGRGKRTAGFAGGGAGVGALIGGLAGGGKGALIGGLTGAGAGTAAGAYTGSRDVVIPSESRITFRLTDTLRQ